MDNLKSARTMRAFAIGALMSLPLSLTVGSALAEESKWVGTWAASPQPTWQGDFPLPTLVPFNLWNQTVRQKLRISLGGKSFRVVISNTYGKRPLKIDTAAIALAQGGSAINVQSSKVITFSGSAVAIIPPGAPMVSDPISLDAASLSEVTVSFHVASPTPIDTFHWDGQQTSFIAPGDQVGAADLENATTTTTRIFLSDVIVESGPDAGSVVAFGDSITDGAASGVDANTRWPDYLAANLAKENIAVLNAGISGARLLQSLMGENGLARFDRDVLAQPNVKTVVVLLGINDISWPGQSFAPNDPFLTKDQIITGFRQLIARSRMHGVRIVAGTLTPFKDALKGSPLEGYYNEKRNALRLEVNDWIRTSGEFDAVVDLDKILQDANDPQRLHDTYQADYLHLSPDGNKVVADALTADILF